jgi:hypothetical protein
VTGRFTASTRRDIQETRRFTAGGAEDAERIKRTKERAKSFRLFVSASNTLPGKFSPSTAEGGCPTRGTAALGCEGIYRDPYNLSLDSPFTSLDFLRVLCALCGE